MRLSYLLLSALMVPASLAGVTSPAHASPPPVFVVSDQKASDRADELANRGLVLGNKDRYAEAEPLMREAWGLKRSYDIAANLGIVEVNLKKWRDAAEHLKLALKTFPANGKPEHKKLIETMLTTALAQVAALTIEVKPDKAEVFVDGQSVGTAPLTDVIFVEPGAHRVEAKLGGYDDGSAAVQAAKGSAQPVTLALARTPPPPPPPPLVVKEAGRPGVAVLVTGGALAAAGLVVGAVLTGKANAEGGQANALDAKLPLSACAGTPAAGSAADCATLKSTLRSESLLSDGAVVSFIAGGALPLTTAALGVWAGVTPATVKERPAALRVVPMVSAQGGGMMMVGAW